MLVLRGGLVVYDSGRKAIVDCVKIAMFSLLTVYVNIFFWQDLDTYIHRSGRTGRAGRSGISIVFYKPNQEAQLRAVGKRAVCMLYDSIPLCS